MEDSQRCQGEIKHDSVNRAETRTPHQPENTSQLRLTMMEQEQQPEHTATNWLVPSSLYDYPNMLENHNFIHYSLKITILMGGINHQSGY